MFSWLGFQLDCHQKLFEFSSFYCRHYLLIWEPTFCNSFLHETFPLYIFHQDFFFNFRQNFPAATEDIRLEFDRPWVGQLCYQVFGKLELNWRMNPQQIDRFSWIFAKIWIWNRSKTFPLIQNNVLFTLNRTKCSSVLLLCVVRFNVNKTLVGQNQGK